MSYDSWKTTDPADRQLGRASGPERYACLSCEWIGKGSIARAQHYYATRHQIVSASDPRVSARLRKKSA